MKTTNRLLFALLSLAVLPHFALAEKPVSANKEPGVTVAAQPPARERTGRGHHMLRGVVNLNQADSATLEQLPGVGEVKAARIIAWRQSHAFKKVEDLDRVKGFGRKTLSRLKAFLSVTGPSTLSEEAAPGGE